MNMLGEKSLSTEMIRQKIAEKLKKLEEQTQTVENVCKLKDMMKDTISLPPENAQVEQLVNKMTQFMLSQWKAEIEFSKALLEEIDDESTATSQIA